MRVFSLVVLLIPGLLAQWDPHNEPGTSTIVHLFEWKWSDVRLECERFLGPMGYAGVQVSPPTENVIIMNEYNQRPWWERYQVVSYDLNTRSGTESEFQEMVAACNSAGVRIYVDLVINHMTGPAGQGTGTGGTYFDATNHHYPGVPYSVYDFNVPMGNCNTASGGIETYDDPYQVRNCELVGLKDLITGSSYVREKIVDLMNKYISYGVAGFRIDAAKHMWPEDIEAIVANTIDLSEEHGFPAGARPFVVMEVIDHRNEAISYTEYLHIGYITEFLYGRELNYVFRRQNPMRYLENWGEGWGMMASGSGLAFIDNHDNQRGDGYAILTFRVPRMYKMATAFELAHPYGLVRLMSSFYWEQDWQGGVDVNNWYGPPHDENYNILDVTINEDDSCGNDWICEHRWRQIYNMVRFRNAVGSDPLDNWWAGSDYQIAFSRGNKGFLAINNEDFDLSATLQTGMPSGEYCDVISGNLENGSCTGDVITVNDDGTVNLYISGSAEDPMVAIHINAKL